MAQQSASVQLLEKIVSLAKRRGFVFQSSEIYGGLNGCWDYGPLGVEMLRNVKEAWWRAMTSRSDIEGLDASILMHPKVWEASGHVQNFSDPMVDCKSCKARFRLDHLFSEMSEKKFNNILKFLLSDIRLTSLSPDDLAPISLFTVDPLLFDHAKQVDYLSQLMDQKPEIFDLIVTDDLVNCPNCGTKKSLTSPRNFNLMFETYIGPVKEAGNEIYLRPET
ncbi:MAG: glycine--tRNA ligase, partial [Bacteroidota bacterium]|nr:glycine--tRNA ligase [Bacteroidota bacterium]